MLIKKADVKNHLAAKRKKHHILRGSTVGQMPAEYATAVADDTAPNKSSQEPPKPAKGVILPMRSHGGR